MPRHIGGDPWKQRPDGKHETPMVCVWDKADIVACGTGTHESVRQMVFKELNIPPEEQAAWREDCVDGFAAKGMMRIRSGGLTPSHLYGAVQVCMRAWSDHTDDIGYATADPQQRKVARDHGEKWRVVQPPRKENLEYHLQQYMRNINGGKGEYYYDPDTGTCVLTLENIQKVRQGSPDEQRCGLKDILDRLINREKSAAAGASVPNLNRAGRPELVLFNVNYTTEKLMAACRPDEGDAPDVLERLLAYCVEHMQEVKFARGGNSALRAEAVYEAGRGSKVDADMVIEEQLIGLPKEMLRKVRWEKGANLRTGSPLFHADVDTRVRGIINYYCNNRGRRLKSINIGTVIESNATHRFRNAERRDVYVVDLGLKMQSEVEIIRRLHWDTVDYLDHQLKEASDTPGTVELAHRLAQRHIAYRFLTVDHCLLWGINGEEPATFAFTHIYKGLHEGLNGARINCHFYRRPLCHGIAVDKIDEFDPDLLKDRKFRFELARIVGEAAALNMMIGRGDATNRALFCDGDEIVQLERGEPTDIVLADITGGFHDTHRTVAQMVPDYEIKIAHICAPGTPYRKAFRDGFHEKWAEARSDIIDRKYEMEEVFRREIPTGVRPEDIELHDDPGDAADYFKHPGSFKACYRRALSRVTNTSADEAWAAWPR